VLVRDGPWFNHDSARGARHHVAWNSERTPMAGLKDKGGFFIDKERLDLTERKAMEYWMKKWGVTKDQLTAAHRKVGKMTKDIAAELGKRR